jgi:hypothetical protein
LKAKSQRVKNKRSFKEQKKYGAPKNIEQKNEDGEDVYYLMKRWRGEERGGKI